MVLAALGAGRARVPQHAAAVDPQHYFHRLVSFPLDSRFQALCSPAGHYIHPKVHDENDQKREVEGKEGGEERVTGLLRNPADALVHRRRLLPSQERTHGDDQRRDPHQHEDCHCLPLSHDTRVFKAVLYTNVPVDGDHAEAEDGGCAAEHIHGCPNVAENAAKHPASQHLQRRRKGQNDDAYQKVCYGQVHNEEVCDSLQLFIANHGEDNKNISNNCHQNKHGEEDPHADDLRVHGEVPACCDADVWGHELQSRPVEIQPIVAFVARIRVCHFETPYRQLLEQVSSSKQQGARRLRAPSAHFPTEKPRSFLLEQHLPLSAHRVEN